MVAENFTGTMLTIGSGWSREITAWSTTPTLPWVAIDTTPAYGSTGYRIEIGTADVTVTVRAYDNGGTSRTMVMRAVGRAAALMAGEEVIVSELVSNGFTSGPRDEYGNHTINGDLINGITGRFRLRVVRVTAGSQCAACQCAPDQFLPGWVYYSSPRGFPDTATLTFNTTAAQPTGWRSPNPTDYSLAQSLSDTRAAGRFAAWFPPNTAVDRAGVATAGTTRTGCDAYLDRFTRPIVMRRQTQYGDWSEQGVVYVSDPIQTAPQHTVVYTFRPCAKTFPSPTLGAAGSKMGGYTSTIAGARADAIICEYNRETTATDGAAFRAASLAWSYKFGTVATVTLGGTHSPETRLACAADETAPDNEWLSLSEGCYGSTCPPAEISVKIENPSTGYATNGTIAGTYTLARKKTPITGGLKDRSANWGKDTVGDWSDDNAFSRRALHYSGTFDRTHTIGLTTYNTTLKIFVYRHPFWRWFSLTSGAWSAMDPCGCDTRPFAVEVYYSESGSSTSGGSFTVQENDPAKTCAAACVNSRVTVTFQQLGINQIGPRHLGTVTILYG